MPGDCFINSKQFFYKLLTLGALFSLPFFLYPLSAKAAMAPLSGWAWSENVGWISFSSTNCDRDANGVFDGVLSGCPVSGAAIPYGVTIDTITGDTVSPSYAWAEHVGWISLNASETVSCPTSPCAPKIDKAAGEFTGWARACAVFVSGCSGPLKADTERGGWDGWIRLSGTDYGTVASECDLDGYAWGSDIVGWIHFRGFGYGVSATPAFCSSSTAPEIVSHQGHDLLPINVDHTHDGARVADPDNNLQEYEWQLLACPSSCPPLSGASGSLSGGNTPILVPGPTYRPTVSGRYRIRFTITDQTSQQAVSEVEELVTGGNVAPVANAGLGHRISVGAVHAHSEGFGVDANDNLAFYAWELVACPSVCPPITQNESGVLPPAGGPVPAPVFRPIAEGAYRFRLTVTDTVGLSDTEEIEDVATFGTPGNFSLWADPATVPLFSVQIGSEKWAVSSKTKIRVSANPGFALPVNLNFHSASNGITRGQSFPVSARHMLSKTTLTFLEYGVGADYHVEIPPGVAPDSYLITLRGQAGSEEAFVNLAVVTTVRDPNIIEVFRPFLQLLGSLFHFNF